MNRNEVSIKIVNPQAERLQLLVQEKLSDDRLGKIIEQLAAKAEQGNVKALDYLLNIGGFVPSAPKTVTVNQYYAGEQMVAQESLEDGRTIETSPGNSPSAALTALTTSGRLAGV